MKKKKMYKKVLKLEERLEEMRKQYAELENKVQLLQIRVENLKETPVWLQEFYKHCNGKNNFL